MASGGSLAEHPHVPFSPVVLQAHGEAEAELAWMSRAGLVDTVLTDDSDSVVFGTTAVICMYVSCTNFIV